MKIYKNFTNFDVYAISKELNVILERGSIENVYALENILILKLSTKIGKKNLIIKSDSRINLTDYDYPIPKYPTQYIMSLRKFLKNRRIICVRQHNFDRIVIIELSDFEEKPWKFIIQLFNKGNFILLDDKNIIKIAKRYRKFKDRDVLAGKEFIFPDSRGMDFLTVNKDDFMELFKNSDEEIVRHLARNINIAGLYGEEICCRAELDKKTKGNDLNDEDLNKLFNSFKKLRNEFLFGEIDAQIILDNDGTEITALPLNLNLFEDYEKKKCESFNEAVDEFHSKMDSDVIKKPSDQQVKQKIKAQEKILLNQSEYLNELRIKKKMYYKQGEFIYANFNTIEKLFNVILNARSKKNYSWEEINKKLKIAKLESLEGAKFFKKIISSSKQLVINFNDEEIYLNLNKSVGENANIIYSKGKKADKKTKGTIRAMEKIKSKIEDLLLEKDSIEVEIDFLIKKPKKKWYEKFRWFMSSNGFLVIGGRDASSNEAVFKKHLDSNDLVLHTNFPGSPLTVIKNPENKEITTKTIQEAAIFVASFSRAWKEACGVVDVFYVLPEQVSKSPPSGEFLPKGSFIISGKKNSIKNAKTELAIGLKMKKMDCNNSKDHESFYPSIICGPENAIKKQINGDVILIKPSKNGLTKGKLAKQIKHDFIEKSEKELKKWIKLLSLDDIILALPTGSSVISRTRGDGTGVERETNKVARVPTKKKS